jgi:hypothetical protein
LRYANRRNNHAFLDAFHASGISTGTHPCFGPKNLAQQWYPASAYPQAAEDATDAARTHKTKGLRQIGSMLSSLRTGNRDLKAEFRNDARAFKQEPDR